MNLGVFALVVFGNLWIWRIYSLSALLAILTFLCTVLLYLLIKKINLQKSKRTFLLLFLILLIIQWKTTDRVSLIEMSNDQQRVQHMRLNEYPPVKLELLGKTVWIPLAHWFEGRKESIAFFRILKNTSEIIDPNLYFFANHPRERVGVREFEKFPYILLPFFVYGILLLAKDKMGKELILSVGGPIILLSFIGGQNLFGPFSLFPFIGVTTACGIETFHRYLKSLPTIRSKILILILVIFYIFVLIQMISYALN